MAGTIAEKILKTHLKSGEMESGKEISIFIDQTLTQDATGTMAYLQFEALGIKKVKTKLSVSYIDHNTDKKILENIDAHKYLQSVADRYGIIFSPVGNGICHQIHLELFGVPGKTLIGSDSHTPTAGGLGMLAIGAGGLDVATAMGGSPFYLQMPKVLGVKLTGKLKPWVTAKDAILELLRILTVKGGVNYIIEYFGEGIQTLSVPERATICNMGAELGATSSIFPSDNVTKDFLKKQDREESWKELCPDENASYDRTIEINLSTLEPLIACPHSPDNVKKVKEIEGIKVHQVIVGSCTNSSYNDLMVVANVLKGRKVKTETCIVPGSSQVYELIRKRGALEIFKQANVKRLESACGPCIGVSEFPKDDSVSIRTFNRNFEGRFGTKSAKIYLCSPETAVACALTGEITDPRSVGEYPKIEEPDKISLEKNNIIYPTGRSKIIRGENIKPLPLKEPLTDTIKAQILIKLGDNISTDHIMPAGAKILPLRSNIPAISEYVFHSIDKDFIKRAKEKNGGFILAGDNYGQGSSREHAALAPMYLGIKAVIAKSFARIHKANLVNFGILPLEFANPEDYDKLEQGDILEIEKLKQLLNENKHFMIKNKTKDFNIEVKYDLSRRLLGIIIAGGLLNYIKKAEGKHHA